MTTTASLLVELGTEELPPKALPELAKAFFDGVCAGLAKRGIAFSRDGARPLYSPRRLAVIVPGVAAEQPTQKSEVLGPYLNIGLTADGLPTPALLGFAGKNGLTVEQLEKTSDGKGERFVARSEKPGALTAALLPDIINEALKALPIPKPMRWGSREISFVRPAHWLVVLLGDAIVDAEVLGLKADRMSRGHRFHHEKAVWISSPEDYVDALRNARVLVDPDERRARVRSEIEAAAVHAGGIARIPEPLLEEVNCLVEWPRAILCSFDRSFLRVPQEALISTMEANQKFFPVLDAQHRLTERFIGIANIESKDEAEVRKGYERVIRPRFADAQFFFDEDRKQGLAAMAEGLKTVTYQAKLGTLHGKALRVAVLAERIADRLGLDRVLARRAAELAKADLQSRLVNEFPELQGIAGRYYAMSDASLSDLSEEDRDAFALSIDEAYMPRFASDGIPSSSHGRVQALAERLYVLAGVYQYAGQKPTGNKDPFALRRAALGFARILIEGGLDLDANALVAEAIASFPHARADGDPQDGVPASVREGTREVYGFILDRLRSYYADQGFTAAQFDAVANRESAVAAEAAPTQGTGSLLDFDRRLRAIGEFAKLPEAEALAAANKRIRNILKKAEGAIPEQVDAALLHEPAENALAVELEAAITDTDPLLAARDYVGVLKRLAALRAPVDAFFDGVMVMAEDLAVRGNRLALLRRLADRFATVAAVEQLASG